MAIVKTFITAVITALVLDFLWLGVIASSFYKTELSVLMRLKPDGNMDPIWWAAALVYVLIPAGILGFVHPLIKPEKRVKTSLFYGFLFGIVLYGVYDFTNYSLVLNWPLSVVIVDICWGGVLCALVSLVSSYQKGF